jgi:peptidase M48-like protein
MNAFWILCVTLSLAVFFIGSAIGTLIANAAAWVTLRPGNARLRCSPGVMFSIRVFPFAFGAVLTVGFTLPSFLLLEPTRSVEAPEPYLIVLASLALMAIIFFAVRWARLLYRSQKTLTEWLRGAELLPLRLSIPVYQIQKPQSLIAVVGILHPKVFVGRAALASLRPKELQAAIDHELAHVRSLDNLKQLVLKITRLPHFLASLAKMDFAWSAAAELSADANALSQGTSALELSSAIVKVGRLKTVPIEALAVAACHLIPPDGSSSALAMRIQHLQNALETHSRPKLPESNPHWFLTLLSSLLVYLLVLPTALPIVHRWTEWLVK